MAEETKPSGMGVPLLIGVVLLAMAAGVGLIFWSRREPDRVTVAHVLIAFQGTMPTAKRSLQEAALLAGQVLERARGGEDFAALVRELSDDPSPDGIYPMCNTGVKPSEKVYARAQMVPGFGNIAFSLKVGDVGLVAYDPKTSPYGWHILKRIR